ncbi:hypothetical protein EX30DRAFT_213377 [Ascodesmis nigricans]|uniref:Uncharacterized protein n=1 Tax=Ascodesmis nigricans TaxID=341454 RepID=A0A4S2MZ76_9PEZI|nr:hypothetical protein EX30DRAFT_213377 [Ascodesmis nigricans]
MHTPHDGSSTDTSPSSAAGFAEAYNEIISAEKRADTMEAQLLALERNLDALLAAHEGVEDGDTRENGVREEEVEVEEEQKRGNERENGDGDGDGDGENGKEKEERR